MISIQKLDLDVTDFRLLALLMRDGRATWADLAHDLQLTAPAIAQRVRRLEDRGVIRQFTAVVDSAALAPVGAFIWVRLAGGGEADRDAFRATMRELSAVQECHLVAGEDGYLLKVRFASMAALEQFVDVTLPAVPGVASTRTNVMVATIKESPVLPMALQEGA